MSAPRFKTGLKRLDNITNGGLVKGSICVIEIKDENDGIEDASRSLAKSFFSGTPKERNGIQINIKDLINSYIDCILESDEPYDIFIDSRTHIVDMDNIRESANRYKMALSKLYEFCKNTGSLAIILRSSNNKDMRIVTSYECNYYIELSTYTANSYMLSLIKPKINDDESSDIFLNYNRIEDSLTEVW